MKRLLVNLKCNIRFTSRNINFLIRGWIFFFNFKVTITTFLGHLKLFELNETVEANTNGLTAGVTDHAYQYDALSRFISITGGGLLHCH